MALRIRVPILDAPQTGVPNLVKVWDGSAWQEYPLKVWDGSAWQAYPVKYWDGSAWQTI